MPRSPHKKQNGWARGYVPEFSKKTHSHNDQGGVGGKKKKRDRVKSNPPGYPMGVHLKDLKEGHYCLCGGCYNLNIDKVHPY